MNVSHWMSWLDGVDVAGMTDVSLPMPNVIVHAARMVHSPLGSTPAGLVLIQPDPNAPPAFFGFVSVDERLGQYFGPKIFAGTPFEKAPVRKATIDISVTADSATSMIRIGPMTIATRIGNFGAAQLVVRGAGPMPFTQQGVEHAAAEVSVEIDGKPLNMVFPPVGPSGGPASVLAPCGIYVR